MRSSTQSSSEYSSSYLRDPRRSYLVVPSREQRYGSAYLCFLRAKEFVKKGNFTRAREQYDIAIDILKRLREESYVKDSLYLSATRTLSKCYTGKAKDYERQGLERIAAEQSELALKAMDGQHKALCQDADYERACRALRAVKSFIEKGELEKAEKQYDIAIDILEDLKGELCDKDPLHRKACLALSDCYVDKAMNAEKQSLWAQALEQNNLAIKAVKAISPKLCTDKDHVVLSRLYFKSSELGGQLNEGKIAIEQALLGLAALKNIPKSKRKDADHRGQAQFCVYIGKLYDFLGKKKAACRYFKNAIVNLKRAHDLSEHDLNFLIRMSKRVATYDVLYGDDKIADKYFEQAKKYQLLLDKMSGKPKNTKRVHVAFFAGAAAAPSPSDAVGESLPFHKLGQIK